MDISSWVTNCFFVLGLYATILTRCIWCYIVARSENISGANLVSCQCNDSSEVIIIGLQYCFWCQVMLLNITSLHISCTTSQSVLQNSTTTVPHNTYFSSSKCTYLPKPTQTVFSPNLVSCCLQTEAIFTVILIQKFVKHTTSVHGWIWCHRSNLWHP